MALLTSGPLYAGQSLSYSYKPTPLKHREFVKYFPDFSKGIKEIAAIDLNEDGLDEYVVRPRVCERENKCRYEILAQTTRGFISLASLKGYNLVLGQDYSHGIRNLKLYTNSLNDYDYELYVWDPISVKYIERGTK